jgi:hypothetical protein
MEVLGNHFGVILSKAPQRQIQECRARGEKHTRHLAPTDMRMPVLIPCRSGTPRYWILWRVSGRPWERSLVLGLADTIASGAWSQRRYGGGCGRRISLTVNPDVKLAWELRTVVYAVRQSSPDENNSLFRLHISLAHATRSTQK